MSKRLKNYFIPNVENDFKPHSLQKTAVILMSMLVLLTFAFANLQALLWINSSWLVSTVLPAVVVELTNETRQNQSLGGLTRSSTLDAAAQLKADHMAKNSYFAHYAPDGTSPWHWFDEVSYTYVHAGENLAVHFTDSDEVVDAWMNSPSHRDNILNGDYTEIGVGTAKGEFQGYPTVFVVQLFGTPASRAGNLALSQPAPAETLAIAEIETIPVFETSPALVEAVPEVLPETPAQAPAEVTAADLSISGQNQVPEVVVTDDTTVLVSNTVTTSQAVAGIEINQIAPTPPTPVSTIARIATQPQTILNMVYAVTSIFVFGALLASIFIEIRKQHPIQIAYGTGLLATMALLTYIHAAVLSGAIIA